MSLINKMLSDLDERHNYNRDQDKLVLGDLAAVTDTGFRSSRVPYNFLVVCFFLIAVSVAIYGVSGSSTTDVSTAYTASPATAVVVPEYPSSAAVIASDEIAYAEAHHLSGLKLDVSLPLFTSPAAIPVAQISNIKIENVDNVTNIYIHLDRTAEFRVYSLQNPDRFVLEIDNAQLQSAMPAIPADSSIERLRYSNLGERSFRLVADTMQALLIDNTGFYADANSQVLSIRLMPDVADRIEMLPVPAAISVVPVEESGFGQMDIRPTTTTPAMTLERSLSEAKTLYARKDFRQADDIVLTILKQQPLHIEARRLYASTLISRGNIESAFQVLDTGLNMNPGISEWAKIQASLLVDQGQKQRAVSILANALPQISRDQEYYAFYAALLQGLSRHDEAADFYRALVDQQPDNNLWWMGLGISLDATGIAGEAIQAYQRALQGDRLDYELRQYVQQQIERLSGQAG